MGKRGAVQRREGSRGRVWSTRKSWRGSVWRKGGSGGTFLLSTTLWQEGVARGCVRLCCQGTRGWTRKQPQALPGEVEAGHEEEFVHGKWCQALEGAPREGSQVALEVSKECAQCSGLGDKMGIDHRLGSMTLEVFSNLNHSMKSLWLLSQLCSRTALFLPVAQQPHASWALALLFRVSWSSHRHGALRALCCPGRAGGSAGGWWGAVPEAL